MERVDVAIVGGGIAGTSAARAAADRGAEVVVFEKGVPRTDREHLGPDSTDSAGMLDYWVELAGLDPDEIPDDVILQTVDRAAFVGPTETLELESTAFSSEYPHLGLVYDRVRFDDWLRERAEDAGAHYRIGATVESVETDPGREPTHTVTLRDGEAVEADHLILADGPQRPVTLSVLSKYLPEGRAEEALSPTEKNHIAYQEYRRVPEEVFEPECLKFYWGYMPNYSAYPWEFPKGGDVASIGVTMPMNLDIDDVQNPEAYALLDPDDDRLPSSREYVKRHIETMYGDRYDLSDFPLVEDRGKSEGTGAYPISSTRPVDSPVGADIAVVGGAMGATSPFHEGGGYVGIRTGTIAGDLAARGELTRYNDEWKDAIGHEIRWNVAMAELTRGFGPDDWDRMFRIGQRLESLLSALTVGWSGIKFGIDFQRQMWRYRNGGYVQLDESEYAV